MMLWIQNQKTGRPRESALILVGWIWIRIQVGKKDPQKRLIEEIFCMEVLDVLF
jgi:hypothetical protein